MKIFTLSFLFVFAGLTAMAQDTITNPGFENWVQDGANYRDPVGWQTLNSQTGLISVFTCLQDSAVVHSGKYSAKLVTKTGAGFIIPGILSTGAIHQSGAIDDGTPINSRPTELNGWYKYQPVANDTASFSIGLTKAGIPVGAGALNVVDTADWTFFSIPVTYNSATIPDSVQLLFFSGTNQAEHLGSTLWIDDLSYSYNGVGIAKVANNPIGIYPNPANHELNIDNQTMRATTLNLYTADGQLVKLITMHEGLNTINVSNIAAGYYLLSGLGANGSTYHSSVIIDK